MDNVVTFNPKATKEAKNKESLMDVLDFLRAEVEAGRVVELVAATMDDQGEAQIHVSALDLPGAVGLYEIGKSILMNQYNQNL